MHVEKIRFEVADSVGYVRMNHPTNLNAIDMEMARELKAVLRACEEREDVRVVVVTGLDRCFSAGGDIGYFVEKAQGGDLPGEIQALAIEVFGLSRAIRRLPKPVIASCAGAAAGAGANLALSCDFVICADNVTFLQAFVNLGLVPDTGGTYLLARDIGWHRALDLIMTGRPVRAAEALSLGLVNQVVPAEELEQTTAAFAARLAGGPARSYANSKRQIYEAVFKHFDEYGSVEEAAQTDCARTEDFVEGITAFTQKRKPTFSGK